MGWVLVQMPFVQTWLVSRVTHRLSANLHTKVSVRHVNFSLFDKMLLEDVLVQDHEGDTLISAAQVRVHITDWWFFKDRIELHYVGLEDATIKLQRSDSVWNYQFLADYFGGGKKAPDTAKGVALDLKSVELDRIHFLKRDGWRGEDMDLQLYSMSLNADKVDLSEKKAVIRTLAFTEPGFAIRNYPGRRPNPPDTPEVFRNDPLHLRLNPGDWDIRIQDLSIRNGSFRDDKATDTLISKHFDGSHIHFYAIELDAKDVLLRKDTITAQLALSTKERSGFEVKKLSSRIRWYPEAMEFGRLDLRTGKSHLRNYFAMRFTTLDDMSDFLTRIRLEADFTDADVDSDDIAWFAPEMKDWKKHIRITGRITGPIADLHGRKVVMQAGKNTLLNGDIHLTGLPDINKTYIDFKSNDFRTTYADMVTLIPNLRSIRQPRLDRIEWLRFQGNFRGTINNFIVSDGLIGTNLGTMTSNVNMKISESRPSVYSGDISTDNFDLGQFLDNDQLGKISFQGKINGTGLKYATLNATLDGTIHNLDFNDYTYRDIRINGTIAQKKFNGQLVSADSNLDARLNGLIDLSQAQPRFDFDAEVTRADLEKLHFVNKRVRFNGKFRFNFTGDNIDNFLGTARIYDASVFKNGQRISFDSLTLESSIIDNNKTITVVSNEFDGAIVGEFSIKDLPASFQTFLNKYYPSYIKPARTAPSNQNFSFVITTKKVDDYVDFFNSDLKGFNNAGVSGRIDTRSNLLDLNVEFPAFNYKSIAFNNLSLKGRGNLDSLSIETTIGEVFLNDSLHFPGTRIQLSSANDLTRTQITTSASQTLNSANISAHVQTLPTGVHIVFDPSTFDINSKTWTIDKGGELALDNNIISANALKINSGDQQALITTHPSAEGNWNDVHIELRKVNIGDFTPYLVKNERLEGLLTGSSDITNPFGKFDLQFNGSAEQFRFNNDSIGKVDVSGGYNKSTGMLNAAAHSDNKDYHFDIKGQIPTSGTDSAGGAPINITTDLADTRIDLLQKYLEGIFSNLSGHVTGHLQVTGPANHLQYLGTAQLKDASLKVNYTQCEYRIPAATIRFKKDTIDFGSFQLKDRFGHTADLTRGRLFHHAFKDLGFDFELNTNRMLLLDTKATDNNQFYGSVIGKAKVTMTGPQENMQMFIKGEPTDSSNLYLPPSVNRESGDADFIVWKVYGKEMKNQEPDDKGSNLFVTLDINANNYANVYLILDPLSGDVIKTNGHGSLNIKVGTSQDLSINGRYEIDRGNYNFTFQSFIHKPFILSEGVGNYIQWSGNPYDADISIEAVYRAENVRFSDLGLSAVNGLSGIQDENVKRYRGDILVTANLNGKMTAPAIVFHIDLPPNSPLKNDQIALGLLQTIQDDPNELNKQVSCLVILNSFVPLSNSSNAFDAPSAMTGVVVGSISGALSNAFTKGVYSLLRRMIKDNSLRFNFNTTLYNGNYLVDNADQSRLNLDRTNFNFSVVKSFMNEKLTLTLGSALDFGLTAQQVQASSFQFLPDVTAEYKITADGRIALTFFYRDSYNYFSSNNHTQNSSGSSISYRRDFDRIDELFKGKKKKKKEATPIVPAPPPPTVPVTSSN
ncbi:MAG: translocation/assembly module TamB domain-containing protein [Bacteroidota bacterium]|nr:translocation/assembly module TamB domain-containing protein [Bacteroidota bacterium]MDP4257512.1 translocation/assembly module TamB domain-containing protein [Bacteroidota bacterium]